MEERKRYNQLESERQAEDNLKAPEKAEIGSLAGESPGSFHKSTSEDFQKNPSGKLQKNSPRVGAVSFSDVSGKRTKEGRRRNRNSGTSKKQLSGFSKFLLIYSSSALVLIAVFLFVFRQYVAAYEYTRDEHIIKSRLADITAAEIDDMVKASPLCEYENTALIAERLNSAVKYNAFSCLKIASDNDGKVRTYSVFSDGVRLVGVTVENSGEKASFGFEKSDITSISLGSDDTVRRNNVRVIFPKGSEIWINGFRAARDVSFSDTVYPLASGYEKNSSELPSMSVYEVSGFVIEPSVEANFEGIALKAVHRIAGEFDEFIFDFPDTEKHSMIITAPEEAVVSVGGVELSEHELKEKGIPYDSYEDNAFNRAAGELPMNCRYRVDGLLTIPECTVSLDGAIIPCSESNTLNGETYYIYSRDPDQLFRAEIHVPEGTEVYVNGVVLGTEQLRISDYIYDEISDFSDLIDSPLTEQLYIVEGLYKKPVVEVKRRDGFTGKLDENEGVYKIGNTTDDTLKSLNCTVVDNFITKYVEYTAAGYTDAGSKSKYSAMLDCVMENTQAYEILYSTRNSFVQNLPCDILSLDINSYDYMKWGDNCFSCTVDFTAELRNFSYKTDEITGWKLYFTENYGKWYLVKLNFE